MPVVIDSRVRLDRETVEGLGAEKLDEIRKLYTHQNPAFQKWLRHKRGPRPPEVVSSVRKEKGGGWSFPRGRTENILLGVGPDVEVEDRRLSIPAKTVEWKGDVPYGYQRRLIDAGVRSFSEGDWVAGIWRSKPGSGKTSAVLQLISELGLKTLVVAPTNAIFDQWIKRTRSHLGVKPGIIQGPKRTIGNLVTVAMQQTVVRCVEDIADEFGAAIFDEAQKLASDSYQKIVDKLPAIFRLAVSGDERRADGCEFLIYDQFGTAVEEVSEEEVIASGGAVPVEVVLVPTDFVADWYKKLSPGGKFLRHPDLLEAISEDEQRNKLIVELALRCHREGEQALVMSNRRAHCQRIDSALCGTAPSVLLLGGDKEFEKNVRDFSAGRARFAVGTFQAVGVGFESHRELARGVFASPVAFNNKGRMQMNQFLGRYARSAKGKQKAVVFYPWDVKVFGKNPAVFIRRWCGMDHVSVLVGERRVPVSDYLKGMDEHEATGANFFD